MDIINLRGKPTKTLAQAGKSLGLPDRFAAPHVQPEAFALLVQTVDQLKLEVELLRIEVHRRWWQRLMFWRSRS